MVGKGFDYLPWSFIWRRDDLISGMTKLITDNQIWPQVGESIRQRLRPALKCIRKCNSLHSYWCPFTMGYDLMCNTGGRENSWQVVVRVAEVVPHLLDVVPLLSGVGDGHVIGVQLKPVELPLEHEDGSCKSKWKWLKLGTYIKMKKQIHQNRSWLTTILDAKKITFFLALYCNKKVCWMQTSKRIKLICLRTK